MGHQRRMVRADLALMLEEPSSEVSWMNIDAYGYCFEDVMCVCVKNVCIIFLNARMIKCIYLYIRIQYTSYICGQNMTIHDIYSTFI